MLWDSNSDEAPAPSADTVHAKLFNGTSTGKEGMGHAGKERRLLIMVFEQAQVCQQQFSFLLWLQGSYRFTLQVSHPWPQIKQN